MNKNFHIDAYKVLEVKEDANFHEIKKSFIRLVKTHHPDAGGDKHKIISINAAWEILRDKETRAKYDLEKIRHDALKKDTISRSKRNNVITKNVKKNKGGFADEDKKISIWIKNVYEPINKLLNQIINPFASKIKELSADPYDDILMNDFCQYLEESNKKIKKVQDIYQSMPTPYSMKEFSLTLYHCLSQTSDSLKEFERYTMGYVDQYLHDGKEMLKEAKKKKYELKEIKKNIY